VPHRLTDMGADKDDFIFPPEIIIYLLLFSAFVLAFEYIIYFIDL